MRNRLSNLHAVDLMIVEEIPEVEIVAVEPGGKMVNDEAVDVAANADPAVVVEVVMEIVAVDPVERMANVVAVDVAENAGPVVVVDAPVIAEVAGGAKAVAEVAADEAGVAEAKPSSLIV